MPVTGSNNPSIHECRWRETKQLLQGADGTEEESRSYALIPGPPNEPDAVIAAPGDYIRLIPYAEEGAPQETQPTAARNPPAYRIMQIDRMVDLKGLNVLFRLYV